MAAAVQEGVHVVGLSVLSGSHLEVVPEVVDGLRAAGAGDVPVIVGGIIPPDDAKLLTERGIARVFTPKDYELTEIMDEIVDRGPGGRGLSLSSPARMSFVDLTVANWLLQVRRRDAVQLVAVRVPPTAGRSNVNVASSAKVTS